MPRKPRKPTDAQRQKHAFVQRMTGDHNNAPHQGPLRHGSWHANGHDRLCVRGGVRSRHQHWLAVFSGKTCDCCEEGDGHHGRPFAPMGGAPSQPSAPRLKPTQAKGRKVPARGLEPA